MNAAARRSPAAAAAVVGLSLAGAASVLFATRWGIGTSVDSVAYIRGARELATGVDGASLVQHAPLYSWLLAAGAVVGLDPVNGARWLNALTFGVNIFLVGFLVRRTAAQLPWLWAIGSVLMLVLVPMFTVHITALSEPVFLTCALAGFWSLARYLESPTRGWLLIAAAVMALTLLARYAGAACILTGLVAILFMQSRPWRLRIPDAMLFGAISSVPMAVWMVRNMLVASSATGRELAFHPVGRSHAWQALYTASGWLLIPQSAPDAIRFVVWLAVAALLAIVTIRFLMESTPIPALIRVLALFVLTYTAFLVISISFLDANTPLDDRILLPVLAAALILALLIVDRLWPLGRGASMVAYASLVLMILLAGGHGLKAAEVAATGYEQGWGFSSVAWQRSPALSQIAHLAPQTPIFSNAPEIVYLHTGRQARGLPRTRFLMNQQPNREFATQMAAVAQEIRESCGVVVYLRNLAQQAAAREAETRDRLSLDVLADESDGVLWGVTACQP